ncbi:GtrA family protein [Streptococcaceae bacterium ESL0687]|nr:GtrA family protein [Streptococcaceae bacterium ESL0687]
MKSLKKLFQGEVFSYLFFGVLTTLIFIMAKMLSYKLFKSGLISEIVAQALAIIFAFLTNKFFVFKASQQKKTHVEFFEFLSTRLLLTFLASLVNWYFIDKNPDLLGKIFATNKEETVLLLTIALQVFTIVSNYLFSKFLIFRQK